MSTTTATDTTPSKAHVIRTLAKSLREYRTASLLSPLFVIVEAVIEIAIPTVIAILIDKGISGKSMPDIWKYGGILIACAVVSLCAGFLSGRFAAIGSSGFAKNLRHDEFEKVQQFSFANIDRFSTGSIITRLTTDVTNVQNAYQMLIRVGMRAPIMLIVAWIFAFRISPQISMVFLACIPVLAVGLFGLIIVVHPIFERVFHTYDELNNVVDENLQGVRVVKSFNREDFEGKKFGRISLKIYEQFCKAEKLLSINSPLFNLCMYASLIAIAWVGARQIVASGNNAALGLTTGDLTALVTYAMQIMMAMMMLSMIFVMVIISRASAERICGVLTEESTIREADEPITTVADGFIQEFPDKYNTYIEQGGTNVSGGQRQRLCIARALLKKPKILILDDSTSAVDTKTDKLIREAFHHEIPNTTKIIIAQRVASVEESDKIVVMHEGRILDQGTNAELLERCEEYRSIYESQTQQHSQQDLDKESQDLHEEEAEASGFATDYNEDMRTSDVIARQKEREREQQAHMAQDIEAIKGGEQR